MPKAVWNQQVIAESSVAEIHHVEGNVYFPRSAVKLEYIYPNNTHSHCFRKGVASSYSVVVDGKTNDDTAWFYPGQSEMAARIKDPVAFWHGNKVEA